MPYTRSGGQSGTSGAVAAGNLGSAYTLATAGRGWTVLEGTLNVAATTITISGLVAGSQVRMFLNGTTDKTVSVVVGASTKTFVVSPTASQPAMVDVGTPDGTTVYVSVDGVAAAAAIAPSDLPGLALWFKADGITGLVDNDPVASWTDSSGNARHATQATSTKRPLWKTNILNGQPVVRFDGVDDFLETAAFAAISQPGTVFIVCSTTTPGTTQKAFDGIAAGNRWAFTVAASHLHYQGLNNLDGTSLGSGGGGSPGAGTAYAYSMEYAAGANDKLRRNGGTALIVGDAGSHTLTGLKLGIEVGGAIQPLIGDIAEVIVYNRALSADEHDGIGSHLAAKYGLSWTLVA